MAKDQQMIMRLLRILTPEEINQLTTTSVGVHRIPLTELVEYKAHKVLAEEGAKILPFRKPGETIEEVDGIVFEEIGAGSESSIAPVREISEKPGGAGKDIIKAGVLVHQLIETYFGRDFSLDVGDDDTPKEISMFIIQEKKKFEESYSKLKSKEVLGLYNQNAAVDIEQERTMKDDLNKSSQFGVLVNKKQF